MRITRSGELVTRAAPQNRTGATSTSRPDALRRRALTRDTARPPDINTTVSPLRAAPGAGPPLPVP